MTSPGVGHILIETDSHGIRRVKGTRVALDNLLHEFLAGASPEDIAGSYPTVPLSSVYSLIGHYLANRTEIDDYLLRNDHERDQAVEAGRRRQSGLRDRLLARVKSQEAASASLFGG